jgi:dienelactone hydrolase
MKSELIITLLSCAFATTIHAIAPIVSDVPDQIIAQSTNTGTLYFTIGDTETTFTALTMSATSSNTTLIPNNVANLQLGGTSAQRTIKVVPVVGQQGSATISLTVTDGESLTASSTFNVTVTATNTPPTLTGLPSYQIVSPSQTPPAVSFTVGDAETAASSLIVTASSSNTTLVPNANITLGSSGSSRTVQVTPISGQRGAAVIKLRVTDALGAFAQSEFIFSVFDAASANNSFKQPRGIYLLDSTAGTTVNGVAMHDGNVRNLPFVDGYVLRTEWATLEPTDGVFDFTIIDNIFTKLPANQKLSLMVASGVLPTWLNTLSGVTTWTAGTPSVTAPIPWNATAQERYRLLLVALGNHVVDGVQLRNHPRLGALDPWIPGLKSGIRDPDQSKIKDIPTYSRTNMQSCVLTHLANVTDNFPNVPVMIGFWTYIDNQDASFGNVTPWEQLRQAVLAQHNGTTRPRVAFWMENLAANRSAANVDPWVGLPNHTFTAPLYNSQNNTPVTYQVLGSWSRPFAFAHVGNLLNGSPEDGMDYGFNDFQCRYYEHYQADVDFANYTPEFQRWHDFLNALPGPPLPLVFSSSQGSVTMSAANGSSINITLSATGGTAPYSWSIISGALPNGVTLSSGGVLSGASTQTGTQTITVQATDATSGSATQQFTLTIAAPVIAPTFNVSSARNVDGSITLTWPTTIGGWYQIETSSDLTSWTFVGNSSKATTTAMTWTDNGTLTGSQPSTQPRRFYRVRDWGVFTITYAGNNFTYTDAQRTVTGIFIKPTGSGPFPSLIINHGTSGTASGFGLQRANEMSPWGLACIAANLTHQQGATQDLTTWGYSPENLARIRACEAVLATRSDVNLNRLAMWGHSRGAFASIGVASDFGRDLKALGFTAGGVLDDADLSEPSYPSVTEASHITAPTIMFLGSTDPVVPPANSLRLQTLLTSLGVTNTRIVYDTTAISPSTDAHNIQNTHFYTDTTTGILDQWHAWLMAKGVLP